MTLPAPPSGTKQRLDELGPERFAHWMLDEKRVLLDRHRHARRPSIAPGDALSHARYGDDRAVLRELIAAAVLGGMLGRRHLRRRDALSQGRSLGAAGAISRGNAEPAAADAAALRERRWLRELPGQRRALLRRAGCPGGRRCVSGVRLPELGRQHAGSHRGRVELGKAVRGRHLLQRESLRSARDASTTWRITSMSRSG